MKDSEILILGGAGLLLFMAMKKKAAAATVAKPGSPQPGVTYATPTAQATVVAGLVNGVLNWLSGTPKTTPVTGNVATPAGPIVLDNGSAAGDPTTTGSDGLNLWNSAMLGVVGSPYVGSNDGSTTGDNVQNGTQVGLQVPSLATFWTSGNYSGSLG